MTDKKGRRIRAQALKRPRAHGHAAVDPPAIDRYCSRWFRYALRSSSSALASFRSAVSKPSVNQP